MFLTALPACCQSSSGELRLHVADPSGRGIQATIHLLSQANQYSAQLETDKLGDIDIARLPYGVYRLEVGQSGFAAAAETVVIRSSIPVVHSVLLKLATVEETDAVQAANTLIDPEQPGNVDQVGSSFIQHRLAAIPGRSLQDLVNSQPGWLYEGNAVLHPRGSEYQTQFVVDGIRCWTTGHPALGPRLTPTTFSPSASTQLASQPNTAGRWAE